MSDTTEQTITKEQNWVDVVTTGSGTIQNLGSRSFRFKEVTTTPLVGDEGGHILAPGASLEYTLTGVNKISMRSLTGDGLLAKTED